MAGAILGTYSGKSCDSNVFNNNDMHLGRELFENVIASQEYKDGIARGHYIGFLGHPEDPGCQDFQNACIVMTSMALEDSGDVTAEFNLVDTPVGRIVKAFQDAGVQFGISIRGAGDVAGDGEVDPETFVFRGFDLVAFPAYNDCVPTFTEIAASTDTDKQKKYKQICAAVKTNLKSITSCEALEMIKEQFPEGTDPYVEVTSRIEELNTCEPTVTECTGPSLHDQKVNALVQMYTEAVQRVNELEAEVNRLNEAMQPMNLSIAASENKIRVMKRIHATQLKSLEDVAADKDRRIRQLNLRYTKACSDLKAANQKVANSQKVNLNYVQKIQANNSLLQKKDDEIETLNSKLRETVTASKELRVRASNCDAEITRLKNSQSEAEEMIYAYQTAYANMFANAIGKSVSDLAVTASTTPDELRKLIAGSTSTSNIPAKPDVVEMEGEYFMEGQEDDPNELVLI